MGIAIINLNANNGLNRTQQNVIPLNAAFRKFLNTDNLSLSYLGNDSTGVYSLRTLSLGDSTQPYVFSIPGDPEGVTIDPISGRFVVSSQYENATVTVRVTALFDDTYYIGTQGSVYKDFNINVVAPQEVVTYRYSDLSAQFRYNGEVGQAGGSSAAPAISYLYTKTGSDGSVTTGSTEGVITYAFQGTHTGATINSNTGIVTFLENSDTTARVYPVTATITLPDGTSLEVNADVTQHADTPAATLDSITASVVGNPNKLAGTTITSSDFIVTGHYSDGTTQQLTSPLTITPTKLNSYGDNVITIKYGNAGIVSTTVTMYGIDDMIDITYSNPSNEKSVPTITATLNNSYTGYNHYMANTTTNGNINPYNFAIQKPSSFGTQSSNYTFAKMENGDENVIQIVQNKGNVLYTVRGLLEDMPEGGILVDRNIEVGATKYGESEATLTATITNPLTYMVTSYGWNNDLTTLSVGGACYGRSANSSGLTTYVPATTFSTASSQSWKYYKFTPSSTAEYVVISIEGDSLQSTHCCTVQSSSETFLSTNGASVTVTNAIAGSYGRTSIYKLKGSDPVYIMYLDADEPGITVKVQELVISEQTVSKHYIAGLASEPFGGDPTIGDDSNAYWPLKIVTELGEEMTFTHYKELSEASPNNFELYDSVTFTHNPSKAGFNSGYLDSDGTLSYKAAAIDNSEELVPINSSRAGTYILDITNFSNITITHATDSTKNVIATQVRPNKTQYFHSYFSDSSLFRWSSTTYNLWGRVSGGGFNASTGKITINTGESKYGLGFNVTEGSTHLMRLNSTSGNGAAGLWYAPGTSNLYDKLLTSTSSNFELTVNQTSCIYYYWESSTPLYIHYACNDSTRTRLVFFGNSSAGITYESGATLVQDSGNSPNPGQIS